MTDYFYLGADADAALSFTTAADDVERMEHPFDYIKRKINADPDYAWGWHCNLAVPIMDATGITHEAANEAAALIMAQMFDCDITQHPNYAGEKSGAQEYFEERIQAEREEDAAIAAMRPTQGPALPDDIAALARERTAESLAEMAIAYRSQAVDLAQEVARLQGEYERGYFDGEGKFANIVANMQEQIAAKDAEIARLRLEVEKEQALQDSSYKTGLKAGWNLCVKEDHEGYAKATESTEHIREFRRIREARATLAKGEE